MFMPERQDEAAGEWRLLQTCNQPSAEALTTGHLVKLGAKHLRCTYSLGNTTPTAVIGSQVSWQPIKDKVTLEKTQSTGSIFPINTHLPPQWRSLKAEGEL